MAEWEPGQRCRVVEHDKATGEPVPGGKSLPAVIEDASHAWMIALLADGSIRTFHSVSRWGRPTGTSRWRLLPGTGEDAATAAGREAE